MNLYSTIKWLLGKIPPKLWPWNKDASAKHLVWMVHILIVAASVGFAAWLLYAITIAPTPANAPGTADLPAEGPVPQSAPGGARPPAQPEPLPMWVRVLKALSPLLAPLVSYGIWRYLPEPNGGK